VLDKPEGVGGESLLAAMQDTRFPEVSHRLQRGVHIGPEDGMLMDFLDNHFATLRDFLALWGGTLVRSGEGYIHLVPGDRYHGAAQLGRHDMLVGMALAHMRTDPTLIGRGSSFDEIANAAVRKNISGSWSTAGGRALSRASVRKRWKVSASLCGDSTAWDSVILKTISCAETLFIREPPRCGLRSRPGMLVGMRPNSPRLSTTSKLNRKNV
jgi:hypothetical protein